MVKNPVLRNAPVFILSGEKKMGRTAKGGQDKNLPNKNSVFISVAKTPQKNNHDTAARVPNKTKKVDRITAGVILQYNKEILKKLSCHK